MKYIFFVIAMISAALIPLEAGAQVSKPNILGHNAIPIKINARWDGIAPLRTDIVLKGRSLDEVNKYANNLVAYKSETKDHWQSPRQTLKMKTGDCEDYAILKRALLLNLGYRDEDMLIVFVKDILSRANHALLAVNKGGTWYFLDSQNNLVLTNNQVRDYAPIAAFSGTKGWTFGKPS